MLRDIKTVLPIEDTREGNQVVSGRDLHRFLEVKTRFSDWIKRSIDYGMFDENVDFTVFLKNEKDDTGFGGHRRFKDYAMTLDMAKEVAMMQRTERGKQARRYFIQIEKEYKYQAKVEHKPLTLDEKLSVISQSSLETRQTVKQNTADIKQLKDTFPISNSQQQELNQLEHALVIDHLGGKDSNAYAQLKGKAFAQCWRDFKRHFKLPRYNELPKIKFNEGKDYLKMWAPDTDLRIEIKKANNQLNIM